MVLRQILRDEVQEKGRFARAGGAYHVHVAQARRQVDRSDFSPVLVFVYAEHDGMPDRARRKRLRALREPDQPMNRLVGKMDDAGQFIRRKEHSCPIARPLEDGGGVLLIGVAVVRERDEPVGAGANQTA